MAAIVSSIGSIISDSSMVLLFIQCAFYLIRHPISHFVHLFIKGSFIVRTLIVNSSSGIVHFHSRQCS